MASYQDNVTVLNSSITKLPSITTNISGRSSATEKSIDVYLWMGPLRRQLDHSISYSGIPRGDDIEELSRELIKFIIRVLQSHADKQMWLDLNTVLTLIKPYTFFMKSDPFFHYVERIIIFYTANSERLFDIPILETLKSVFPECVSRYQRSGGERWKSIKEKKPLHVTPSPIPKKMEFKMSFFGGENPYAIPKHVDDPEKQFKSQQLTLSAIDKSIGTVTIEKAQDESMRRDGFSTVGAAANIDFPGMFTNVIEEEDASSSIFESKSLLKIPKQEEAEKEQEFKSITGREAVELFLNHKHLHKVKFIYLNVVKSRHFRPYDLVSVPRDQIEKEHYIFSSFGVLHIYPDGDQSETLTLAEWNKHAVIWNALKNIRFFKDYLLIKMLRRWRLNVRMLTYLRFRKNLSLSLLHAVPEFGSALLHIFRLIQELSEVQFFPDRPAETYQFSILDFASNAQRIKSNAKDVLQLFFCYSRKVVDATKETCAEQLKFYEDQVRQTKPLYVKESMYLQKMKKKLREDHLRKAREMMKRQNQLISLIDQVIAVHLLGLARTSVTRFVHTVLCTGPETHERGQEDTSDDGSRIDTHSPAVTHGESLSFRPLFSAKFVFNKLTCQLEMQPSAARFKEIVTNSFQQIFDLLCAEAYSMHVRESKKKRKSPERPNTAPASYECSEEELSYQNSLDSSSSSGQSESSLGLSDATRLRSEKTVTTGAKFSTSNSSPRIPKKPEQLGLTNPDLTPRAEPLHDKPGKATPNMLHSTAKKDLLGLVVDGNRMNIQYNPLDKKKLIEIFFDDPEISEALAKKDEFVNTAVKEVNEFCEQQNKWLPVIGEFCNNWSEAMADSYKGRAAHECELSLNLIKDWISQVENMPRFFFTSNKLLYVDGRNPYNTLVPILDTIFKKLVSTIVMEAKQISTNITNEVTDTLKVLKNKDTNMSSFAAYASTVNESIKKKDKMTERVSYTRSIFDVVKINCRQLTEEEEKLHDTAKSSWEAFLFQLKDATNFVANQRPVIMKRLDEMFKELHDAAMNVCLEGSCHPVTDPNADPAKVIAILQRCITDFQDLRGKISEVNYFHDAICNQFYSIDDIKLLGEALYDKLELWQYIKVTKNTIHDWKITPFRKFNTDSVLAKLDEWAEKSIGLAAKLGADYPVLAVWQEHVENLAKQMPLFKKLAHPALKARHWKEIFTGMGEAYEPGWTLLVDDLLSINLTNHIKLINKVYQDATSEYTIEKILVSIKKDWENRQFDLAKHIFAVKIPELDPLDEQLESSVARKPPVQEKDSDTYVLVGAEKLLKDLTESNVTLQAMFQSRHAYDVKSDAEIWSDTLGQIGEIVHVWLTCQEKWMYLNRIFNGDPNMAKRFPSQHSRFQDVDSKYREFIDSMLEDSKVLSVLSRRHGQKGWRELQGDALRKHLTTCVQMEEDILREITELLSDFRSQFPRLYFVSDDDIVRLLGISGHPQAYIPFVRKCFRGAHSLIFSLPQSAKSGNENEEGVNMTLDLELNSARLEATHVIGLNDESLEINSLPASNDATKWLATLEKRIKHSLIKQLQECIDCRVKSRALMISETFNELCETEQFDYVQPTPVAQYSNWPLKYTLQAVLLTESILWFRELKQYLKTGKKKEVHEELKKLILHRLRQYSNALVDNSSSVARSSTRLRFQCVLSALSTQAAYHRDLLRALSDTSVDCNSFAWHKLIKHTAEIVDYSKTAFEIQTQRKDGGEQGKMINKSIAVGHCFVEQFDDQEDYGYEYISSPGMNNKGLCVGMVYTPLTERCMIDMWLSLKQGQCAGLFGPTGVGKSAVLSELARIFGRFYINLNCSAKASIDSLKRALCGMVESGAWLCFDHVQRLPVETLSKLSQHVKHIHHMYAAVKSAADTQYTVRGHDECGNLKRSNSITTLHGSLKDGSATAWQPCVTRIYINSLRSKHFEDYDAQSYLEVTKNGARQPGSIIFDNQLLKCEKGFGVFMSFTNEIGTHPEIPDCLRLIYRPTCVTKPNRQKLIEVWLLSAGFYDAFNLSVKLDSMYDMINNNTDHITADHVTGSASVSSAKLVEIDVRTMKIIVMVASLISNKKKGARSRGESVSSGASDVQSYSSSSRFSRRSEIALQCHQEELALVDAVLNILPLKLASADAITRLKECLRNIFPMSSRPLLLGDKDNKLAVAVQQQMQIEKLQHDPEVVDKVCQLHAMLQLNQSVVIAGPAGSGKTTLYTLLSKALNSLCNETTMTQIISQEQEQNVELEPQDFQNSDEGITDTESNQLAGVSSLSDIFTIEKSRHSFIKVEEAYSRINISVLFPNAYTLSDLFGYERNEVSKQGILVKLLKDTMVENEPEGKQELDVRKPSSVPAVGRRASTAHARKSILSVKKWLVLDGEILSSWMDSLSCFLDDHKRTSAGRSEDIQLRPNTNVLFECADFASASPAIASRCAIVHCDLPNQWKHIAKTWLDTAYGDYAIKQSCVEIWTSLMFDIVPKALHFLAERKCLSVLSNEITHYDKEKTRACFGVHEVTSFLSLFSSSLKYFNLTRDELKEQMETLQLAEKRKATMAARMAAVSPNSSSSPTQTGSIKSRMESVPAVNFAKSMNLFGFSFVWAFGGSLLEHDMAAFDQFAREAFYKSRYDVVKFPRYETVYDYFVDEETGQFTLWEDKIDLRPRPAPQGALAYTPIHQFERYALLSHFLMRNNRSLMLVGELGCGKSSLIQNLVLPEIDLTKISISPGLSVSQFQRMIESKAAPAMRQHNLGLMAHPNAVIASRAVEARPALFFLDDLSCAGSVQSTVKNDFQENQPLLELLRQILIVHGVYESERILFKALESEVAILATCPSPSQCGAGLGHIQHMMSPRLTRHFTVVNFQKPTRESILSIYHHSVQSWLEEFPTYALTRHYDLSQAIIAGAYDLYLTVFSHFKPSPRHPHYVFSLHDINKIIKGVFLLKPAIRGRPVPLRHRGANELFRRPRIGGGQIPGRFRHAVASDDPDSEVLPMMKTVVRLWLHECCRVFQDKLSNFSDKNWFAKALQDALRKHFCSGAKERMTSPPPPSHSKVRVIKTPIPSSGSTPMPQSLSSITESGTEGDAAEDSETFNNLHQSDFEVETVTTQGTEYIVDDDTSDGTSLGTQPREALVDGATSSANKSSANSGSVRHEIKFQPTGSASTNSSRGETTTEVVSTSSDKINSSQTDDVMSETTTQVLQQTSDTDGDESRVMTAMTGDDDAQSAVTGYTTEVESIFETEGSFNDTSGSESTATTSNSRSSIQQTPIPVTTVMQPSAAQDGDGEVEVVEKRGRPTFGRSKISRPGGAKFGVTFVPGLVEQEDVPGQSNGPLVPFDQILGVNESPSSIIFCQAILTSPNLPDRSGDMYSEVFEIDLTRGLKTCRELFNSSVNTYVDRLELAFFGQAIRHAARLSRAFCMERGHTFLMSSSPFKGRHSLTRLVALFNNAKIFHAKPSSDQEQKLTMKEQLRRTIKNACFQAGVNDKRVVLLVDDEVSKDPKCMDDVCSLMRDGQCPSLYTNKELAEVAASFSPTQQLSGTSSDTSILMKKKSSHEVNSTDARETAQEKLDKTLELFFSRILSNVHVVVMAHVPVLEGPHDLSPLRETKSKELYFHKNEDLKSFHRTLRRCPDLMTRFACVDLYGDWQHSSWRVLAQHYIEDSVDLGVDDMPWPHNSSRLEQVQYITHLMAYIHTDAIARTRASLQNGADKMISPLALRQMVQVFVGIAMDIKYEEHVTIGRLYRALGKVVDTEEAIHDFMKERSIVIPKLQEARKSEQTWKSTIEEQRHEYSEARDRCSQEEEVIKDLDQKVDDLKEKSEMSFGKLHPMYDVAVAAQDTLSQGWLEELKHFKNPPSSAVEVILCLCDMFEVSPASWENGKALISRPNFFEDMVFYDKDNMPEEIFLKIEKRVKRPKFRARFVERGSKAASMLCKWIHSVYRYAKKVRDMQPNLNALSKAEKKLFEAQAMLGSKRVRCIEIKENLDNQILKYKNASAAAKAYEKNLKQLNTQVEKATFLRETMHEHSERWNGELREAHFRLDCAVGDAIIVAACVTYFGQFAAEQKQQALRHWTQAAKYGYIDKDSGTFEIDLTKFDEEVDSASSGISDSSEVDLNSTNPSSNLTIDDAGSSSESFIAQNHYFVRVREKVTPINYLLTSDEQRSWHKANYPRDLDTRFDGARLYAMTVFQNCSWIFLFDPDDQAFFWITASMKKMRKTLTLMEKEKFSYDDHTGVTSTIKSEKLEIVDDDEEDDETLRAVSELDGSETETQVTIRVSTAGSERIVSRASAPELEVRKSTHESELSDNKDESVSQEQTDNRNSPYEVSVPVDTDPLHPLDELWVCSANDEKLSTVLESAIIHGAFLLITNVELATPQNSAILQNIHSIRTFSMRSKEVHFCFRLFLSTAVSINWAFNKSTPIFSLPLHHFAITDLSLTANCLEEKLESIVLGQERPEFETQRRLMEADRFHLEEQMDSLQLDLIQTIGTIQGNILEHETIIDILQTCKEGILLTDASLKEVKEMETNLLQKKSELVRISEHGLMLYNSVSLISIIDPLLYHLTASQFTSMYQECLKVNKRTKAKVAAAQHVDIMLRSRVVELKQSLTELMLKYVHRKYFQSDIAAFSTLISLNILVSTEKLSRKAMEQFLATEDFQHPEKLSLENFGPLHKPSWLSDEAWRRVKMLEKKYPLQFPGIAKSFSMKARHWQEYFSSPPMLLAKVPSSKLYELTVGEKALLWKVVQPKKFNQIAADLSASVLGGFAHTVYSFDIDSMVSEIPATTPCVLMLPHNLTGSCFLPLHHLASSAKLRGLQCVEKSALFLDDLEDVMLECMSEGKWLVLDDCHLVKRWPEKFVQLLISFITGSEPKKPGPSAQSDSSIIESKLLSAKKSNSSAGTETVKNEPSPNLSSDPHPDFRIWLITKKSEGSITLLPMILMQKAEFIALETPLSHKELVRKTYHTLHEATRLFRFIPDIFPAKSGPSYINRIPIPYNIQAPFFNASHIKANSRTLILQLSLLFSALLERASFGNVSFSSSCFWTDGESLDAFKSLIFVNRPNFAEFLCSHFLERHLLDSRDAAIVRELVKRSFAPIDDGDKSKNIFAGILRMSEAGDTIDHVFNTLLQKPDVSKLGLASSSTNEWAASISDLSESLNDIRLFVATQRGKPIGMTDHFQLVVTREASLKRNLEFLNIVLKGTKRVKLNTGVLSVVMFEFYAAEVERLNNVIDLIKTDLQLCLDVIDSDAELTEEIHSMLECFARDKLAYTWLTTRKNLFRFHSSFTLSHFIHFLNDRVDLLTKYMECAVCAEDSTSSVEFEKLQREANVYSRKSEEEDVNVGTGQLVLPYNLAVFTRPDLFLRSVLLAMSRSNQHDVFRYKFSTKFLPEFNLEQPRHIGGAFDTIYIDKLRLHKAVYDLRGESLHYSIAPFPQNLPWLELRAVKRVTRRHNEESAGSTYDCPLWINEQNMPPLCGDDDVIMHIPIATDTPAENWFMKGVSITCYLGDD